MQSRSILMLIPVALSLITACADPMAMFGHATSANTQGTVDSNTKVANGTDQAVNATFWRDVKPIATAKCAVCHSEGGIGPFTLLSFNDWSSKMASINSDVAANIMPPWMPDDTCNQYEGDLSLTADEKAKIASWVALGGPEGDANDYVAPAPSTAPPFRNDLTITMPKPYQPTLAPDEYRCFVIPWTATTTKYMTGFGIKPGNASIVHHAIIDIVSPSDANAILAKDGADGAPGFACSQQGVSFNWLAVWAPGTLPRALAAGDTVGTKLVPGTMLVLQVHYHIIGNPASVQPDQTSVELQLANSVQKEGHFVVVLDPAWVAGDMPIPANQNDVMHSYAGSFAALYFAVAEALPSANMAIYQVGGHMHQRGSKINLSVVRNSQQSCLLNIPAWNFNWQNGYALDQPFALQSGDKMGVTCHWNNSAANQPVVNGVREIPQNLNWGEGSDDEMCLGTIYVAPQ